MTRWLHAKRRGPRTIKDMADHFNTSYPTAYRVAHAMNAYEFLAEEGTTPPNMIYPSN
jgi:hypothetical protein